MPPNLLKTYQSHWAYDVSKLVKGISINNLGEFQGNQPADRYNLAQALGRLLDDIESGKVRGKEDVELLRKPPTSTRSSSCTMPNSKDCRDADGSHEAHQYN